jgi:tRNA pseudouridine38-40 synthase
MAPRRREGRTIGLTLAYEGTAFAGWQRQPDRRTVQEVVELALESIDERPVAVVGAGRTDAGVHALGQVASATVRTALSPDVLQRALNARLPDDVRAVSVCDMPAGFDARHDARAKTYHYALATGPPPSPFVRRLVWHVPRRLDVGAMQAAAGRLVGEHDFAAFQSAGSDVETSVRRLLRSAIVESPPRTTRGRLGAADDPACDESRLLHYRVTGTGFLRHMVRTIVGTLVEIGSGRRPPDDVIRILESRDRRRAGATAPPHGLTLMRVHYWTAASAAGGSLGSRLAGGAARSRAPGTASLGSAGESRFAREDRRTLPRPL